MGFAKKIQGAMKKHGWAAALYLILSATGCNDFDSFGSDLLDTGWINAKADEIVDLDAGPAAPDSIISFYGSTALGAPGFVNTAFPLGIMEDPLFGHSEAGLGTQLRFIPTNDLSFLHSTLDSIVLSFRFDTSLFYGKYLEPMDIAVYGLSNAYDINTTYFSNDELPYEPTLKFGQLSNYVVNKTDSIIIREDTLERTLYPQLRIPLDTGLLMGIFRSYPDTVYYVVDSFSNVFNGIAVVCEKGNGYLSLMPEHSDSKLSIYYKDTSGRQLRTELIMSSFAVKTPFYRRDPAGSLAAACYDGTIPGDSLLVMQGAGGRDIRLKMPVEQRWKGKFINYAVLKFAVADIPGVDLENYPLPSLLQIFDVSTGTRIAIDDVALASGSSSRYLRVFGGAPEKVEDNGQTRYIYRMNVTRHFQKALKSGTDFDLVVSPFAKLESPARLVWFGRNNAQYGAKLELTFSE
jgi:hypothetical protein